MAKRRFFSKARRSITRYIRAGRRRSSNSSESVMGVILPAAIYGAGRQYAVNLVQPLTSKIPLGNYADELVLGTAGYLMYKKGNGMIKSAGKAILTVEAASLGSQVVGGAMTSTANTNSGYVYN